MNNLIYIGSNIDSIDFIEDMSLVKGLKDMRKNEIAKFIKELELSNIYPPKLSASDLMVKDLNREGLPRRPMNRFFCFRRVVYHEVLRQGLIDSVKDGVFLTQVAGTMWNETTEENRDDYKKLANELKERQDNFHKDKTYNKTKTLGMVFVNMDDNSFIRKTNPTGKR